MKPLFSITLPTYNRAYVLWKAIQSILAQTEPRWELIVVNDGSTDCTLRLLEEFRDPRIRRITTPNQGPSAARNRGIAEASAPAVAYLDSDNTWHPEFLSVMQETIINHPDNVLWHCGANTTFWERSAAGEWRVVWRRSGRNQPRSEEDVWSLGGVDTNCMVHKRIVADEVGGWDEQCRWLEDWDFFLRVYLAYPQSIHSVPYTLVEYRQVHGSGADGICAEGREAGAPEVAGRRYLFEKWGKHPNFRATAKTDVTAETLPPVIRAG